MVMGYDVLAALLLRNLCYMEITTLIFNLFKSKVFYWFFLSWIMLFVLISNTYAEYSFDKTRIILSSKKAVDTIKLSNVGKDTPINIQTQVLLWEQNNGNDVYKQTKDLIVAPPMVKIPIGKTQIMRLGWRSPRPLTQELAYRFILNDLTPYKVKPNTVLMRLKINMPVFIKPDNPIVQAQWKVRRSGSSAVNITVTNTGNVHIQVLKIVLTNANNEVIASQPSNFYLLPAQSKQGSLSLAKPLSQVVNIIADTDNGQLTSTVNI
jgi:fimbrial chaperone protein